MCFNSTVRPYLLLFLCCDECDLNIFSRRCRRVRPTRVRSPGTPSRPAGSAATPPCFPPRNSAANAYGKRYSSTFVYGVTHTF